MEIFKSCKIVHIPPKHLQVGPWYWYPSGRPISSFSIFIVADASGRPICQYLSALADISVIGQYIGFTDNRKAYRYRLSVSANKEAHIGSTTDMKITPYFSQNFLILAKETCEKFHFFLEYFQFSAV